MKRRVVLAALATVGGGCLSEPAGTETRTDDGGGTTTGDGGTGKTTDGSPTTDEPKTNEPTTAESTTEETTTDADGYQPDWNMPEEPVTSIPVGSREGLAFPGSDRPRTVALWNDTGAGATVRLVVERAATQVVDRSISLAADEWLALRLLEPGNYRIKAAVDGEERWSTSYDTPSFTCNSQFEQVAFGPDGAVASRSGGTAMACSGPTVAGERFAAEEGDCQSENHVEPTVSFRDGRVVVDGSVDTPVPCYRLAVEEATVDARDATFTLAVAAEAEDGACVECEGTVPYEATYGFENAYPDRVVVEHVVDGDRTVVVRVDR